MLIITNLTTTRRVVHIRVFAWDLPEHGRSQHIYTRVSFYQSLELLYDRLQVLRVALDMFYHVSQPCLVDAVVIGEPASYPTPQWSMSVTFTGRKRPSSPMHSVLIRDI